MSEAHCQAGSARLAFGVCEALVREGKLRSQPAFIRVDRETKLANVFEQAALDCNSLDAVSVEQLEQRVRKHTEGQAWLGDVIEVLKAMSELGVGTTTPSDIRVSSSGGGKGSVADARPGPPKVSQACASDRVNATDVWDSRGRAGTDASRVERHGAKNRDSKGSKSKGTGNGRDSGKPPDRKELLGIFLGDVQYLVKDVLIKREAICMGSEAIAWLLALAQRNLSSDYKVTGLEEVSLPDSLPFICTQCFFFYVVEPKCDVRMTDLRESLKSLEVLSFYCGESISVFDLEGPPPRDDWEFTFEHVLPAYQRHMRTVAPDFFRAPDWAELDLSSPPEGPYMVESVRVVPVVAQADRWFVFLVRQSEDLASPEWTTVGGGTKCGPNGDQSILRSAMREWEEEVPAFPWESALVCSALEQDEMSTPYFHCHVRWKWNSAGWANRGNWPRRRGRKIEGVNAMAWIFVEAQAEFFAATSGSEQALIPDNMKVIRPGQCGARCHTEGVPFVEHEVGGWFEVLPSTGQLKARFPGAEVRGDLSFAVFGYRANKGPGDVESRRSIWEFMENVRDRTALPFDLAPSFEHAVTVTPTGLRDKLPVFKYNLGHLSPDEATEHLKQTITSALDRGPHQQYYSEEVECCLELGASPMDAIHGRSLLAGVVQNEKLNESIAVRSAELLCRSLRQKGHQLSKDERCLLQSRADNASSLRFRERWSAALEDVRANKK